MGGCHSKLGRGVVVAMRFTPFPAHTNDGLPPTCLPALPASGDLREYVAEEVNVRLLTPCADQLRFASVRAEPEWGVLGKRLGKSMAAVAKAVKSLPLEVGGAAEPARGGARCRVLRTVALVTAWQQGPCSAVPHWLCKQAICPTC